MKRGHGFVLTVVAIAAASGCVPRRLFWSPDGKQAVIVGGSQLRLSDAEGRLTDTGIKDVSIVAWFPDSKRFLAVRPKEVATWEEAARLAGEERQKELLSMADSLRAEVMAHTGDWSQFKPQVASRMSGGEFIAMLVYLRDHRSDGLAAKLGDKTWNELKQAKVPTVVLQVYEVADGQLRPGKELVHILEEIGEVRISPDGKVVACVETVSSGDGGKDLVLRLSVTPTDGGPRRIVARSVAAYPDWSRDGKSLVYGTAERPGGDDAVRLGSIVALPVRGETGELLGEVGAPQPLVGILYWPQMKVRCLGDGRILFSGMEANLPCTAADMPQRVSLFAIDPARQATVARVLPREAESSLPDGLGIGAFEVSPDGQRVAVAGTEHGNVSVVTLATGQVEKIVTDAQSGLWSLPAWRTPTELALVAPPKTTLNPSERNEWMLWSTDGKTRLLSKSWPSELLTDQQPAPPAAQP